MRERLTKGIFFGLVGNILFVAFMIVCYIFYETYEAKSGLSIFLEALAYSCEFAGFGILLYSDWLLSSSVRMRSLMKFAFTAYIIFEAVMMFLEINSFRFESFYKPYSLVLAIVHSIISATACFAFLQLDPDRVCLEVMITVCVGMILGGMLGNIMGIRVYFSIAVNAVSMAVLFYSLKFMLQREMIEIDCHGDRARVAEYSSDFMFKEHNNDTPENAPKKETLPDKNDSDEDKNNTEENS